MNGTHVTGSSYFNDTLPLESIQDESSSHVTANLMRPDEVVADPRLNRAEKRQLLASWASDARAVQDAPELRQLNNGAVVRVRDIMRALKSLDGSAVSEQTRWSPHRLPSGLRIRFPSRMKSALWRGRPDDDDDPPPCPAMILSPLGGPLSSGAATDLGLAA